MSSSPALGALQPHLLDYLARNLTQPNTQFIFSAEFRQDDEPDTPREHVSVKLSPMSLFRLTVDGGVLSALVDTSRQSQLHVAQILFNVTANSKCVFVSVMTLLLLVLLFCCLYKP